MPRRISQKASHDDLPVTKEALERLHRKLISLKGGLIAQANEVRDAAALGDRSENEEYRIAKSTLWRMHGQIEYIEHQIKRAVIIDESSRTSGFVGLGSTIVVEVGGERKTLRVLGSFETNPSRGVISSASPVGSALMNHIAGDEVTVRIGDREVRYRIISVD